MQITSSRPNVADLVLSIVAKGLSIPCAYQFCHGTWYQSNSSLFLGSELPRYRCTRMPVKLGFCRIPQVYCRHLLGSEPSDVESVPSGVEY